MDLTKYTSTKKIKQEPKEIILDNEDVTIIKQGQEVEFTIKNKKALEKYQNYLFLSPTNSMIAKTNQEAQEYFERSINDKVEGLMFKSLKSPYSPGLRTGAMAKLKETKEDIDVVILGAEHGKGRRAGFYSSFIVAVKNEEYMDEEDKFLEIGKVSSGIKEVSKDSHNMENLTNLLKPLKIEEINSITYFEPKIVLQVRYQEIQKSTTYKSGYALRFPRIISLREDKPIEEINSIEDIKHFI